MEAEIIDIEVVVTCTWKCPNCDKINIVKFSPSPNRIPADEIPEDEECSNCKKTFDPK